MKRVVVFGASGFVGAELCERLQGKGDTIVPVVHSAGNAWRLARHGLDLRMIDLVSGDGLNEVLTGADVVVNCTRGDNAVMLRGLDNLLRACRKAGVARFVHLSSVMVYGEPPAAETELSPLPPLSLDSYGGLKQRQDKMVAAAAKKGLSSVILIPPNISGPYSYYLSGILNALRDNRFRLLEGETPPVSLVDVRNLCHAIELAMTADAGGDGRYFITDDETVSWEDLIADLCAIGSIDTRVGTISRQILAKASAAKPKRRISVLRSIIHLFSSDIREALRKDPLWEKVDLTVRRGVSRMGIGVEDRLRLAIEGPQIVPKDQSSSGFDVNLSSHQLRTVRHSIEKARNELNYAPVVSHQQSMQAFRNWYVGLRGLDGNFADLLGQLD